VYIQTDVRTILYNYLGEKNRFYTETRASNFPGGGACDRVTIVQSVRSRGIDRQFYLENGTCKDFDEFVAGGLSDETIRLYVIGLDIRKTH